MKTAVRLYNYLFVLHLSDDIFFLHKV